MPSGHAEHAGARRVAANVPGAHIWQSAASTAALAQPAGHTAHHGSRPGGRGHPAHTHRLCGQGQG